MTTASGATTPETAAYASSAAAASSASVSATPLLPDDVRLVHIGPPKTGTTALQSAFHVGRAAVKRQGVHYAGPTPQPVGPVLAVTGRPNPVTGKAPSMLGWRVLVREVKRAGEPRVVISSEFFADARPDAIRTIVDDLGRDRVHVVVTLRPLVRIIPSQWQQMVQAGLRDGYDDWLRMQFDPSTDKPTPTFWHRHRHDRLIARWAEVVGPQNVTVVALDDRDRAMVLRVFERLVGLDQGTLVADEDTANRSMTLPEVELVRAFNELSAAEGLGTPLHAKLMRYGAAAYMKLREPDPDEPRIETPQWALDRAAELAREMIANIAASGVRVIGDLENLAVEPTRGRAADLPTVAIPPTVAAQAAIGVALASGLAKGGATRIPLDPRTPEGAAPDPGAYVPRPSIEPLALVRLSTAQVIVVLLRRIRSSILGGFSPIRRRIG